MILVERPLITAHFAQEHLSVSFCELKLTYDKISIATCLLSQQPHAAESLGSVFGGKVPQNVSAPDRVNVTKWVSPVRVEGDFVEG